MMLLFSMLLGSFLASCHLGGGTQCVLLYLLCISSINLIFKVISMSNVVFIFSKDILML